MKNVAYVSACLWSLIAAGVVSAEVIAVQWARQYDGLDNGNLFQSYDRANAVAVDRAGNIAVAGKSGGFYVAKYSGQKGSRLWEHRVGSVRRTPGPNMPLNEAYAVAADQHGNVVATGAVGDDMYTVMYAASDGSELWRVRFDGFGKDKESGAKVGFDRNGDVIVTGSSVGAGKSQEIVGPRGDITYIPAPRDIYTAKYAGSDGHLIWKQRYDSPNGADDSPVALGIDKDGNAVITGNVRQTAGNGDSDIHTIKYAGTDGHVVWERPVPSPQAFEFAIDLVVDQNGDAILAGSAESGDRYLRKYASADGATIWQRRDAQKGFGGTIAADRDGNVAVTNGYTTGQLYVAKFRSSDGAIIWNRSYSPVVLRPDDYAIAQSIQADANGDFVVGGDVHPRSKSSTAAGIEIAKFRGSDGVVLWEKFFEPLGNTFEGVLGGFGLNSAGSVLMAGTLFPRTGDDVDLFAAKLSPTGQLVEVSTRVKVEPGDDPPIGGLIVAGAGSRRKNVLIRGIGPSVSKSGIRQALKDPLLELHLANGTIVSNDNWRDTQAAEIEATGAAPSNKLEAAIIAALPPGAHTAILRSADGGGGIGLVEVYDLDNVSVANLANISTRGRVGTDDEDVMIGGFIVNGPPATVVVRALGPSLPLGGTLADPILELHDANGGAVLNDNWGDTQRTELIASGLAPARDQESAILATLAPGAYTAVVRGTKGTSGSALIEVYNLQ